MNLLENYNSAKQKYGEQIVKELSAKGIPSQFLLSACRFYTESQVPMERIQQLFRQWTTYVATNDDSIDVNKLSFEEFYQTIQKFKSLYEIPNKIFDNGTIQIGEFKNFKEASMFPIPNNMCICKTKKWFKYYQSPHSRYLIIHDKSRNDSKRYVVAIIEYGEVSYSDLQGTEFGSSATYQTKGNSAQMDFDAYQQSLGEDALNLIYNIVVDTRDKIDTNNQVNDCKSYLTNIIENKTNINMKQVIRLTESDLHRVIKESVKKILKENDFHRAYKNGKNLNVGIGDTYTDNEVFECLEQLQEKLQQVKERALTGRYDEGSSMNYLVGAIRGLQAFIDSHY